MLRYACGFKIANEFWESLARSGVTMDNSRPRYAGLAALPRADGENFRRGSFILNLPLASHHSITSSARASSDGGTSMPSALAVFKLMTSSYLVGACTGRSAGFSPLRMRSTYDATRRYWSTLSGP